MEASSSHEPVMEVCGVKITNLNALRHVDNNEVEVFATDKIEEEIIEANDGMSMEIREAVAKVVKTENGDEEYVEAAEQYGLMDEEDDEDDMNELEEEMEHNEMLEEKEENVIEEALEDDSIQGFFEHQEEDEEVENAVFCVSCHPTQPFIISGDQKDRAMIWNYTNGELVAKLVGHTDSVTSVAFSSSGDLCATGSMDGTVKIWDLKGKLIQNLEGPSAEIEWIRWHTKGPIIIAGSSDGTCWMWNAVEALCMQVFAGHIGPCLSGTFSNDGKLVCTGSDDGSTFIWNPKSGKSTHHLKGAVYHEGSVTCMTYHPNQPYLLSGSADGSVCLIRTETGKITKFVCHKDSVEQCAFSNSQNANFSFFASASVDKQVVIYDLRTFKERCKLNHPEGVVRIAWHKTEPLLYSACLDGSMRLWDAREGKLLKVWKGHQGFLFSDICSDGNSIISCGEDQVCLVFDAKLA